MMNHIMFVNQVSSSKRHRLVSKPTTPGGQMVCEIQISPLITFIGAILDGRRPIFGSKMRFLKVSVGVVISVLKPLKTDESHLLPFRLGINLGTQYFFVSKRN